MLKRLTTACLSLALVGSVACVEMDVEDEPTGETAQGELNLLTHTVKSSDVEAMKYTITPVPCDKADYNKGYFGDPIVKKKPMKELTLPGGITKFEDRPFDADSKHQFADLLTLLKTGCYDVEVQPLRKTKSSNKSKKYENSKDCQAASKKKVEVKKGKTTEILLVSQCRGKKMGLLDVIAALNHAPSMVDFEIIPNKFVECPKPGEPVKVKVCARASDPDKDPLKFKWEQLKGPEVESHEVVHSVQVKDTKTECVKAYLPAPDQGEKGHYFRVTVFDQFRDKNGNLIKAEKFYANSEHYPSKYDDNAIKSRASLEFPIHISCVEKPKKKASCPLNKGFWKKFNKYASMPKDIAWPTGNYTGKPAEKTKMCGKTWMKNLGTEADGDAFYKLSHQYIAARLNQANGAQVPLAVGVALFGAHGILSKCPTLKTPSLVRAAAIILAETLRKYNEGHLTSKKCEYRPKAAFDDGDNEIK